VKDFVKEFLESSKDLEGFLNELMEDSGPQVSTGLGAVPGKITSPVDNSPENVLRKIYIGSKVINSKNK
jgi:hypothetical protein